MPSEFPQSRNWKDVERFLEFKEREMLEKEGVVLSADHMDGYKYRPKARVAEKQPWEVIPAPTCIPKCRLENWTHTDVGFETGEGIAYITLNRPTANNALNDTISQGLHDAVYELYQRKDIRCVVLKAEGKMFCAGGDPKTFADAAAMTDGDNRKSAISFMKFLYFFQNMPQFTIGLAQGSAMGSGLGLLAACDMVVAMKGAAFTCSEVKLGTAPVTIAPFLSTKMGQANAKRILCTAANFNAEAMQHMGLVQEVVDDEKGMHEVVSDVCEKLTLAAPFATSRSKRLAQNVANRAVDVPLMEYTGTELATIRIADEAVKGMVAVQAKTKPYWAETPIKPMY